MRAFSVDLRWRIVWSHLVHHYSPKELADRFQVSPVSVRRYINLFKRTGDVQPKKQQHDPPQLLGDFERLVLLKLILKNPGIYLSEIQQEFLRRFGVNVSVSTFCKTLKDMGCTRQVMRRVAKQRSVESRARFMATVSIYDAIMLMFLDESGHDQRNYLRKYGYSVRGTPAVDCSFLIRGVRYTAIPILSLEGIHDVFITEGTMNGPRFVNFVQKCLIPLLNPFNYINPRSVVIMDNASIHHVQEVVDKIEAHGARILFLPPYSPDLMPCEGLFSMVKSIIKENHNLFHICSCPRAILALAFSMVTKEQRYNLVSHCGYV